MAIISVSEFGAGIGSADILDDSIVNVDINTAAAIAISKLQALTKGDLIGGDGSGGPGILGVGANDTVLTADSTEATGMKWATPAAGDLLADGTIPLTANWDVGAFTIQGTQFISDIVTGTAPLVVASTTEVANLRAATATLADVATTVTVTDNEATAEENVIVFAAGAVGSGDVGLEADGDLTYNPSTGVVTATGFAGALTGNADTVTTNANLTGIVTSVGNATSIANKAIAIAKLADGTDGELITWDASGVIAVVPAGTATHVLTSNGAGAAPTFQAPAGGGATALAFVPQYILAKGSTTQETLATNTEGYFGAFFLPITMTVDAISISITNVATAGTLDLAVFSEDGQTRHISITTASISATGIVTTSAGSVELSPGVYYFGINTNGTADLGVSCRISSDTPFTNISDPASEPVLNGTDTITASTMPATITPTSLTAATNKPNVLFRIDT